MHATVAEIQASLRNIEEKLRDLNLLYDFNESTISQLAPHVVRLTWATHTAGPELSKYVDSSVEEYLAFLQGRHFNFMLVDGSLIQLTYDVLRRNNVVGVRNMWFPCPVSFSPEDLEMVTIEELITTTPPAMMACRSPLRIDFSPDQVTPDHPATHMHLGVEKSRMPIQRAMEPGRFVRLILRTAYPNVWRGNAEHMICENWGSQDSLTAEDRRVGFLGWDPLPI